MKTLELHEMENINGGLSAGDIGCGIALVGAGIAFASLVTATGGTALILAAAGWSIAPAGAALSCLT